MVENAPQIDETSQEDQLADKASGQDEAIFPLTPEMVREVAHALDADRGDIARQIVEDLHSADIADLTEQLPEEFRSDLLSALGAEQAGEVLSEVEEAVRDSLLKGMNTQDVADAVATLDSDDAVYVLEDLGYKRQREVLDALDVSDALSLTESLSFPEDSAGRMMQRELIAVPGFWSVGQVIDHLRDADDLPDDFRLIFVVDETFKPTGVLELDRLLRTKRPITVQEIMDEARVLVPATLDQEEVGYLFRQYDLVAAGVVSEDGRLIGCITVDDMVEVVEEEAAEDALRLAGVGEEAVSDSVFETARSRFAWLFVNLGTAIMASAVIALFTDTIEKIVALAILMPIVASMGGNAGTQTLTIAVRALATHDLTAANAMRIVWKEVLVGGMNGLAFAVLLGTVSGFWFASPELGAVIASAMVINMLVAGLSGILVPMGLDRLDIDPALASSVFVTTVTDVVGFFAFLGLAALVLL